MNTDTQAARSINATQTLSLDDAIARGYVKKGVTEPFFVATRTPVPAGATEVTIRLATGEPV